MKFTYQFFDINQIYSVLCKPYGIKEFKNRWYLVAKDNKDNFVKTFALERITDIEISFDSFIDDTKFNISEFFRNSFGINTHLNEDPVKIVLEFEPRQALYVKSKPLHHSQKIIEETPEKLVISLFVHNTYDFRMELLSYGDSVKVIEPETFKNQLIEIYKKTLGKYE